MVTTAVFQRKCFVARAKNVQSKDSESRKALREILNLDEEINSCYDEILLGERAVADRAVFIQGIRDAFRDLRLRLHIMRGNIKNLERYFNDGKWSSRN